MIETQRFFWYNNGRKFRPERYTFPEKRSFPDGNAEKALSSRRVRVDRAFFDGAGVGENSRFAIYF